MNDIEARTTQETEGLELSERLRKQRPMYEEMLGDSIGIFEKDAEDFVGNRFYQN